MAVKPDVGRLVRALRVLVALALMSTALASPARAQDVTVAEDDASFTLSNGTIIARVLKRSGDLSSLKWRGREMLTDASGHAGAYWSHDTTGGASLLTRVTIDPKTNGGARGEVSVKAISGGIKMGHGPGAAADGDFPADIEIRYTLNRGDSGIYTYCTFDHRPEYPAATMTEARFAAKLAAMFDWMTVDAKRDQFFPADLHEGDKYIYTAVQFENRAFGWSSTKERIGFWLLNPSVEFLSGGPTKVEFLSHRDTTPVAAPVVFNYWRSSHYGGASVDVAAGEHWTKTIGPFFLYVNDGGDPRALAQDARGRQMKEAAQWPYDWVSGVDYARRDERATVTGRMMLRDPLAPGANLANLLVGLTVADDTSPLVRSGADRVPLPPRTIGWQTDAKHYQFWSHGGEDGTFAIPHVPAGVYTLRALSDGVLGEFARADVVVEKGRSLDLGQLTWTPVRRGRQLWEIGVPNRTATEFAGADRFWRPELPVEYATRFPGDVRYVIGTSTAGHDWFFQHVPHYEPSAATSSPRGGSAPTGRATPYAISFDLASAPRGTAVLRVAICGGGAREVTVTVNGRPVGTIGPVLTDGAIARHSIQGLWYERDVSFDASQLKTGTNVLTLTVAGGPVTSGIIYDYLRLELDESAPRVAMLKEAVR
jgi:rhamnogalacturonan endolyase